MLRIWRVVRGTAGEGARGPQPSSFTWRSEEGVTGAAVKVEASEKKFLAVSSTYRIVGARCQMPSFSWLVVFFFKSYCDREGVKGAKRGVRSWDGAPEFSLKRMCFPS